QPNFQGVAVISPMTLQAHALGHARRKAAKFPWTVGGGVFVPPAGGLSDECPSLLPQPGGFESLFAIRKVLLPDHQTSPEREQLKDRLADCHAAARSVAALTGRDQSLRAEV